MPAFGIPSGAAYIVIASTTAIVWSFLVLLVRLFLRCKVNGPFGWDDAACVAATALGVIQSVLTLVSVHYGLGYHIADIPADWLDGCYLFIWLSNIFYQLAIGCAMLSICFLICRITRFRLHLVIGHSIAAVTWLWSVGTVFALAFECNMPRPWYIQPTSRCSARGPVLLSQTIIAVVIECCLLKTALLLATAVQMSKKAKSKIIFAFALRLFVLPPMIVRIGYIRDAVASTDVTHSRIDVNILNQVTMHISIILATVPCAKPFFVVFDGGVFKSPHDAKTPPYTGYSWQTAAQSPMVTQDSGGERAAPITWDRRASFAQPSVQPLQNEERSSSRWWWNRRIRFNLRRATDIEMQPTDAALRSRDRQPAMLITSAPHTDTSRSVPSIPESPGQSDRSSRSYLRLTRPKYDRSPSSTLRLRRQSSVDWFGHLRNDEGKTITTITHDPEHAICAAAKRRSMSSEELRRQWANAIAQVSTFSVTFDDEEERLTRTEESNGKE